MGREVENERIKSGEPERMRPLWRSRLGSNIEIGFKKCYVSSWIEFDRLMTGPIGGFT